MSEIDNINHVGMAVRDLAGTAARFEAMGFQLTPFSPHAGAWKPGEPVQKLGSGNRCVMFANNYLEILGTENGDPPPPRLAGFLARHQGAHIICFNTEAPSALHDRLRSLDIQTSGVIPLQRDIDTPDGVRTARFERVQFAPDDSPEGYIQAARHLTPEFIYQPRYIAHENGCTSLSKAFVATDDAAGFARKYGRYLGMPAEARDDLFQFRLPFASTLTLVPSKLVAQLFPGSLLPPLPSIVAVTFRTPDLAAQRQRLISRKFTILENGNRISVPAEEASGLVVTFEDADLDPERRRRA
jgi:glyoxalase-like protein